MATFSGFSGSSRSSSTPASFELADYGALLRRRWRILVAFVIVGLGLSAAYVIVGPKSYTSTASVLVTPTGAEMQTEIVGGRSPTEINLDTEAQVAQSAVVGRRAETRLGAGVPLEDFLVQLTVTIPPNSAVLEISFEASTPAAARRGAHAFAMAYLANRRQNAERDVQGQVRVLKGQVKSLNTQLHEVANKLAVLPTGSAEEAYAQSRRGVITTQISELTQEISALRTQTITPGRIISDARVPDGPSSPIVPLYLASGLLAGLLIGLMTAVMRDRSDRRIRRAGDVERLVHLPVLLAVPAKRRAQLGLVQARSPIGQAFHELCHSITATLGHGNHVLLVTGATAGTGTSVVAANLAAALARTGSGTVLICADLQSFASTRLLGLRRTPGLSDLLLHGSPASDVEQRPAELPRLRVVTPGADGEAASEQLQTRKMERLVAELRRSATYVVIEAPPTSVSADAQALADVADAALVVVEARRAEREQVHEGVRQLDRMGAAILGAVVLPAQRAPAAPDERPSGAAGEGSVREERRSEASASTYTAPMPAIDRGSSGVLAGREPRRARQAGDRESGLTDPAADHESRQGNPTYDGAPHPTHQPVSVGRHGRRYQSPPGAPEPAQDTTWRPFADANVRERAAGDRAGEVSADEHTEREETVHRGTDRADAGAVRPEAGTGRRKAETVRPEIGTRRSETEAVRPEIGTGRSQPGAAHQAIGTGRGDTDATRPESGTGRGDTEAAREETATRHETGAAGELNHARPEPPDVPRESRATIFSVVSRARNSEDGHERDDEEAPDRKVPPESGYAVRPRAVRPPAPFAPPEDST